MLPSLMEGGRALWRGNHVTVLEFTSHDESMVTLGPGSGVLTVKRSELLAVPKPEALLRNTEINQIPQDVWDKAHARAEAIRDILKLKSGRSEAVDRAAEKLGIKPRHVWRLIDEFQEHESTRSLIPQKPGRKVGTRVLDLAVERIIAEQINAFYLQRERPSQKELWQRVAAKCREAGVPEPTQRTLTRRLEAYRDRESVRKRHGAKKAKYLCDPMPGHVEATEPLERVEIDHTLMDVVGRSDDPQCDYVGRPWLTLAIDVFTRCILAFYISFEAPSALTDALCMVDVTRPKDPAAEYGVPLEWPMHGKPKEVVTDNGKDFDSRAFKRGCDEMGIILSFRPEGSPHYGGTIERLIGTMIGFCHILPGTTKNSVQAKGDYESAKRAALTLSELRRWFAEQVLGRYHLTEHRMLRIPPEVAWEQSKRGGDHE